MFHWLYLTSSKLAEIVALFRKDEEQRVAQSQQQADSVRYLHELNAVSVRICDRIQLLIARSGLSLLSTTEQIKYKQLPLHYSNCARI